MALPAKTLIQALTMGVNNLPAGEREAAMAELAAFCGANNTAMMVQSTPGAPAGGGCPIPARSPASLNIPGCPTKCDDCTFPAIETDTRLFSWPEIEDQMWDTDTKIDKVLSGSYPVAAGGTITLEQEARRTLTWIPDVVEISTTWSGGNPQPGFLKYQWATGPRGSLVGQVQFSNPQLGTQYECGEDRTCKRVRFPTYKGCNNIAIGALSSLRLLVTLDGSATSVLEKVQVTAYHRKACCDACATGKSCSCG